MADRKQFISKLSANEDLLALLEKTKGDVVTEAQLKEQRISFAFGNSPASEHITKETVRKSAMSALLAAV